MHLFPPMYHFSILTIKNPTIVSFISSNANHFYSSTYLQITNISLLVIDECHHAVGNSPLAKLMKDFYSIKLGM